MAISPTIPLSGGYLRVNINYTDCKVHQLVARLFIPNTFNKPTINHKNGNKHDNRVDNLEWNTQAENNINAYEIGLKDNKGVKNGRATLSEDDVIKIKRLFFTDKPNKEIAVLFDTTRNIIMNIRSNKTWKHITI